MGTLGPRSTSTSNPRRRRVSVSRARFLRKNRTVVLSGETTAVPFLARLRPLQSCGAVGCRHTTSAVTERSGFHLHAGASINERRVGFNERRCAAPPPARALQRASLGMGCGASSAAAGGEASWHNPGTPEAEPKAKRKRAPRIGAVPRRLTLDMDLGPTAGAPRLASLDKKLAELKMDGAFAWPVGGDDPAAAPAAAPAPAPVSALALVLQPLLPLLPRLLLTLRSAAVRRASTRCRS